MRLLLAKGRKFNLVMGALQQSLSHRASLLLEALLVAQKLGL
jgi:hypothetical protein